MNSPETGLSLVEQHRLEDKAELLYCFDPRMPSLSAAYEVVFGDRPLVGSGETQFAMAAPTSETTQAQQDDREAQRQQAIAESRLDELADKLGSYTLARAYLGLPEED